MLHRSILPALIILVTLFGGKAIGQEVADHADVVVPAGTASGIGEDSTADREAWSTRLSDIAAAHPDVLDDPETNVAFRAFSDRSLDFNLRVYLAGTEGMAGVRTDLNIAIKERFDLEGVAISFPQRDIRGEMVRSGEAESGPSIPLPVSDRPEVPRSDSSPRVGRAGSRGSGVEDLGSGPDGDVE